MKNQTSITSMLGVTQSEMARLLNVSRSLFSLYELGKRDLPLGAKQKLAELLSHVHGSEALARGSAAQAELCNKSRRQIEGMLRENQYQQLLVAKALGVAICMHEARKKLIVLAGYLNSNHCEFDSKNLVKSIVRKASRVAKKTDITALTLLTVKDLLYFENFVLERKLRKLQKNPNDFSGFWEDAHEL